MKKKSLLGPIVGAVFIYLFLQGFLCTDYVSGQWKCSVKEFIFTKD